ncbi:DNA mismatch repair MutS family DNA-binding domain protein, putative (macronuclear) [Tetrahymena thermophila SB210]|uniref:DNA mismatch repair MutS family DNA-binding domain protein, putative n=2 Tax=Tetrahymena thermophila TaxID=5911 RepID=I7M0Z2_TETTS|nr:DNA mismatch repair MutS family DNA-binding domain protein, putative [Tetrahymena thermophila SB210]ABK35677.1 putative mismatch repair protein [Tetrahymena thermophila]EAR92979.2 DNA mismatch repair MutS family DNA-binding domain protein, putative [Tetrahymena thermophila SB210]|eukprot:XP_001013224.2 DNA mismatch repair MutS family DNA-binding domain protein, putative [Tetrahymena thermophila SB210]
MEEEIELVNDKNLMVLAVYFTYPNNTRQVNAAILDSDQRKFQVTEFQDTEYYSNFESLILQTNPQNQHTQFLLLIQYPDLTTEKEKVNDIVQQCDINVKEKDKKSFLEKGYEDDLNKLLKKPLAQYIQESQLTHALSSLACIVGDLQLSKEPTNQNQFTVETLILNNFMKLDLAAINALLIFPKEKDIQRRNLMGGQENNFSTLVDLLDKCKTQIGSRTLKRWIKQPLKNEAEINRRLDIVEYFVNNQDLRNYIQNEFLRKIADLDKLYAKFYKVASKKKHNASLADCIKVYQLVTNLSTLAQYIENNHSADELAQREFLIPLGEILENFEKLSSMIDQSIDMEKARRDNEYQVSSKFSPTLAELAKQMKQIMKQIESLRNEYAQELGVEPKLVESTTHTYLFESKKKETDEAFRRLHSRKYKSISVKKGCISFTTDELQACVAEYNSLKDNYQEEQKSVVQKILDVVSTYYPAMERASFVISELDVLANFASLVNSATRPYVKPNIHASNKQINLVESRHPCLEVMDNNCVANDCFMDNDKSRFHIITGPNMGGKSTFIRQVAICVLLAHIGCFIPCKSGEMPIIDAIITRVGASDMQLRGISTFMSEMLEASNMLMTATENSLIIIDELGRGTSTSEGFGIAWAISEHIANKIKCYCLFATHFHEMTKMEQEVKGVINYYVSCVTIDNKLTMQYKLKRGFAERSYGLFVAETLDFPREILEHASNKLLELESYSKGISENQSSDQNFENFNKNSQTDDIFLLSKNSTIAQKEAVVDLASSYNEKIRNAASKEQKKQLLNELKQKIISALKS